MKRSKDSSETEEKERISCEYIYRNKTCDRKENQKTKEMIRPIEDEEQREVSGGTVWEERERWRE